MIIYVSQKSSQYLVIPELVKLVCSSMSLSLPCRYALDEFGTARRTAVVRGFIDALTRGGKYAIDINQRCNQGGARKGKFPICQYLALLWNDNCFINYYCFIVDDAIFIIK